MPLRFEHPSGPGIDGTVALGDTDNGSPVVFTIAVDQTDEDEDDIFDAIELSFEAIDNLNRFYRLYPGFAT